MKLLFFISKKHLISKKKQTIVSALGVTFGICAYVVLMSFMDGINDFVNNLTFETNAHIKIYKEENFSNTDVIKKDKNYNNYEYEIINAKASNKSKYITNSNEIINFLVADKKVKSVASRIVSQVFFTNGPTTINATLFGIIGKDEDKLLKFSEKIIEGSLNSLNGNQRAIILGIGLAKKLSVKLNENVDLVSPNGEKFKFKVVGIYETGITAVDDVTSFVNLSSGHTIAQKDKRYLSEIHVNLKDINQAKDFAEEITKKFNIKALDFDTANATFKIGNKVRNMISYAVSIAMILVSCFGIYNILNMIIYEKMNDIAILRATGYSSLDVRVIFLLESMIIGVIGGILGILFGYLISYYISTLKFLGTGSPIKMEYYPILFDKKYYINGVIFALISTFLAGYFPAKKAAKIDPVEIIRGK